MAEMSISVATKKFRDHCISELSGRMSSKGWIKIDGSRLCLTCAKKRRRTLYAMVSESSPVFLKCFRASCDLKRFATQDDFHMLGFNDNEAISVLMNNGNRLNISSYSNDSRPIIIEDRIPSEAQRAYFKSRTKLDLTPDNIFKYRIIPNIYQVMKDNFDEDDELHQKFRSMNINDDKLAITFATDDYGTVSYRHTQKSQKVIFNLNDNSNTGYVLERHDDESSVKTLVLCEGIFDLINIHKYFAVIDGAKYIATLGFQSFFHDIIHHYKQHIDSVERLIIFLDSDKELPYGKRTYDKVAVDNLMRRLSYEIGEDAFKVISFVYNSVSKDFGDLSTPIEPKIVEYKK